jgi:ArsR family transcriptional regulator
MTSSRKTARATADLSSTLRALADPTRLRILLMLEGKRRTVGEIVKFFALSQPAISRHLQTLTVAGLVERRREAQKVYYATNASNVGTLCISLADCFPCGCVAVRRPPPGPRARSPRKATGKRPPRRPKAQRPSRA